MVQFYPWSYWELWILSNNPGRYCILFFLSGNCIAMQSNKYSRTFFTRTIFVMSYFSLISWSIFFVLGFARGLSLSMLSDHGHQYIIWNVEHRTCGTFKCRRFFYYSLSIGYFMTPKLTELPSCHCSMIYRKMQKMIFTINCIYNVEWARHFVIFLYPIVQFPHQVGHNIVSAHFLKWYMYIQNKKRRHQIKKQFLYLHFRHPNILRTSDELSRSNFFLESITRKTSNMKLFHFARLEDDRLKKKIDCESSSEVRKMWGCLKGKYENCIFIFRHFNIITYK